MSSDHPLRDGDKTILVGLADRRHSTFVEVGALVNGLLDVVTSRDPVLGAPETSVQDALAGR